MPTSKDKEQMTLVFNPEFARDLRLLATGVDSAISPLVEKAVNEYAKNHSEEFRDLRDVVNRRMLAITPDSVP